MFVGYVQCFQPNCRRLLRLRLRSHTVNWPKPRTTLSLFALNTFVLRNIVTLVVFSQQAEVVAMEGEEHWPLGQFEPGRATNWSQPT